MTTYATDQTEKRFAVIEKQVHRTYISGPYDSQRAAEAAVDGFRRLDVGRHVDYEVVELVAVTP